jgi:hypothetical protein
MTYLNTDEKNTKTERFRCRYRMSMDPVSSADLYAECVKLNTGSRRTRIRFSFDQLAVLDAVYINNIYPSREQREDIAIQMSTYAIWSRS